jgi:hypothetical protein
MSGRAIGDGEAAHKANAAHEARNLLSLVRSGQLSVEGARALIRVNETETIVLRKLLGPHAANAALLFRRNVLRLFDALVDTKMRTRRR